MNEETDTISRLASQTRNIGYYAGLTFGVGYCLTLIGVIALSIEVVIKFSSYWSQLSQYSQYVGLSIPPELMIALGFYLIGILCAIYFGLTVIRNSKSARNSNLTIDTISSSVSALSFMLIFIGIGTTLLYAMLRLSLFSPITGVVGPILLLIGFKSYKGKAPESKLIGAIMMMISIALIYFVAYGGSILRILGPLPGPLLSEINLEAIALLIAAVCAVIFSFPIVREGLKQSLAGIILSISGILFSIGLMYFNFSAISTISNINNLLSMIQGFSSFIPGAPRLTLDSIWILLFGFLLLGISGIIALVTACLPLAISAKQLSAQTQVSAAKLPEAAVAAPTLTPTVANLKYCPKCGASMPLDAAYCLKCGHKQSQT